MSAERHGTAGWSSRPFDDYLNDPVQDSAAVMFGDTPRGQARVARLLALLSSVGSRLRQAGDEHWAQWLDRDRARIMHGDAYGLEHLTQAYGGMGSINDTYPSDDGGIGEALGEIYQLAAQLLADHRAGDN